MYCAAIFISHPDSYFYPQQKHQMKKIYYVAILCMALLAGCKKENDANCNLNSEPIVSVADKRVLISINGLTSGSFEIEYGPAGFTQGSGTTKTFSTDTTSFAVTDYGTYQVYLRNKCDNGGASAWSAPQTIVVDGSYTSCQQPGGLNFYTGSSTYQFNWYQNFANFFDVEYGPTGFTIGTGTRLRTNSTSTQDAIMRSGITYDFYVRANCGGNEFSSWAGPQSVYAATDQNINVPCTQPTNLYAYKINSQEINYTSDGHGSTSYEIAFSQSGNTNTGNILTTSSPNGTVFNPGGFSGTYYFWIRGKCVNGSFTAWSVSQVQ